MIVKNIKTLCLLGLATTLTFSACQSKSDEPAPANPTEVATNATLARLTKPANGWEVAIYPSNNQRFGGYTLFLGFNQDGTVRAASELLDDAQVETSNFKLEVTADEQVINFTTSNPAIRLTTEATEGTVAQLAAYSDEAFSIISSSDEEIRLQGKKSGTIAVLRPATEATWAEQLTTIKANASNNLVQHFRLQNEATELGTGDINQTNRHLSISQSNGATESVPFRYTRTGIELFRPLSVAGLSMQVLTGKQSDNTASLTATESTLSLVAIATPLADLLRTGLYTYSKENTTGRAQRSFNYIERIITSLNTGITEESKQAKISDLQIGTKEGRFGLYLTYKTAVAFTGATSQEFHLRLPLQMTVENSNRVRFTYDLVAITSDATLERYTTNSPFLQILAAGFARIGIVRTRPTGNPTYNESYQGLNFDLTADNPFRPTEITLTCKDLREEYSIKLQVPQN